MKAIVLLASLALAAALPQVAASDPTMANPCDADLQAPGALALAAGVDCDLGDVRCEATAAESLVLTTHVAERVACTSGRTSCSSSVAVGQDLLDPTIVPLQCLLAGPAAAAPCQFGQMPHPGFDCTVAGVRCVFFIWVDLNPPNPTFMCPA